MIQIRYTFITVLWSVFICVAFLSCRKSDYKTDDSSEIIQDFGEGTGTVTWTADKTYIL